MLSSNMTLSAANIPQDNPFKTSLPKMRQAFLNNKCIFGSKSKSY